ncbi:tetrapyrrole-binding protein, chloroplastic-like [Mangifera indica]|uniref:tetrapyrrole-binding protein, chloroplastic-like n=1 Tax=Mangifera indica TaxID=29780 RepID=UPI001CF95592|nr:tetrapyrrole-binding protein, chloroplastic-like [Mangifera indica]
MATNSLHSLLLNRHHNHLNHHLPDSPTSSTASIFLKPSSTTTSLSSSTTLPTTSSFSLSPPTSSSYTSPTSSSQPISFGLLELEQLLSAQNFRQADEETRRLLIVLAGESAQKRGYVFFSEVQFISPADLKAIDDLWRQYSYNKFGYSVQKKIWQKVNKDFTRFFLKVGWMKKLDTEVEQYNYRAFPNEFTWELTKETPEGHLPLTNALRGTQLLNSILSHPAFEGVEEEEVNNGNSDGEKISENKNGTVKDGSKVIGQAVFKPDYSF